MHKIMLGVKFVLFFARDLTVLIVVGAVLIAGAYQIVRDKIRESHRQDQIVPETGSAASVGSTVPFHS